MVPYDTAEPRFVGYGMIHSRKTRSLREMDGEGLPIVPTLHLEPQTHLCLDGLPYVPAWVAKMPLYVRVCFDAVGYPHSFFRICERNQLEAVIIDLLSLAKSETSSVCDITVQPHLRERLGGAVALLDHVLVIETVDGNARGLLREGYVNQRFLLYSSSRRRDVTGTQKKAIYWNGESYAHRVAVRLTWEDINILSKFRYSARMLYEYCILEDGTPIFLEKKPLPDGSFTFDVGRGMFVVWPSNDLAEGKKRRYRIPSLELATELTPRLLHEFSGGAFFSHLAFYAATNKIPMRFTNVE